MPTEAKATPGRSSSCPSYTVEPLPSPEVAEPGQTSDFVDRLLQAHGAVLRRAYEHPDVDFLDFVLQLLIHLE